MAEADPPAPAGLPASSSGGPDGEVRQKGIRQKIARQEPAPQPNTPLNDSLRKQWCQGKLTSPQVQELAMNASLQGATAIDGLASSANWGKSPKHLQESLMRFFGRPEGSPEFTWVPLPLKVGNKEKLVPHPVLMPHHYFEALHAAREDIWQGSVLGPDAAGCRDFWEGMQDTEFVKQHPHLPKRQWSTTIPVGFHGDGGGFYKHESMFVFTWNSVVGAGQTRAKRFVITVLRKNQMLPTTLDKLFEALAWSFNAMLGGISPDRDWEDRPIGGGGKFLAARYRAALVQVRGDWEFMASVFHLPKWNEATNMCWLCRASAAGDLGFGDCSVGAGWRDTRRTHESFLAERAASGEPVPTLLALCKGLRLDCLMIDVLHTLDQGVASHIIGNIFFLCVSEHAFGGTTQQANLDVLAEEMKAYYKRNRHIDSKMQGKLTLDRIRTTNDWPKLKCKAAATRHLAPFALELAQRFCGRAEIAVCTLLVRFYDLLSSEGQFLSPAAKAEVPGLGRRLCEVYCLLARQALNDRVRKWKIMPKLHLFLHLAEWQAVELGNPKFYWVYADEDLVGQMIEVSRSCHPTTVAATAMYKWLLLAFSE